MVVAPVTPAHSEVVMMPTNMVPPAVLVTATPEKPGTAAEAAWATPVPLVTAAPEAAKSELAMAVEPVTPVPPARTVPATLAHHLWQ